MLESKIEYIFKDKTLLDKALTHSSIQRKEYYLINERLEFLGDRVLGLVIADALFSKYPREEEGQLAKRHTDLVKQDALFRVAQEIKIDEDIRVSAGEAKSGGKHKKAILSNAIEALIGAIYKDSGYEVAAKFVRKYWHDMIENQTTPPEDAKSLLQEWAQSRSLPLPIYSVVSKSGSDHSPEFEIKVFVEKLGNASAKASSKKKAEKLAAEKLLQTLKDNKD